VEKLVLPTDCYDLTNFEWTEPVVVPAPKPSFADFQRSVQAVEVLPEPIKFKSLGESLNDLVLRVRSFKRRPVNPFASA
jgi:hypothetical protein